MTDTSYTIHTATDTLSAEFNAAGVNQISRGETTTFRFFVSESDFQTLTDYDDYAGSYAPIELLNGNEKYRDHIPESGSIESLLVGIEPSSDLKNKDISGVWGVIDDISDSRNAALSTVQVELSVRVLARFAEYADHTTAESTLRR